MIPMCLSLGKFSLITGFARFGLSSSITPCGGNVQLEVLKLREVIFAEQDQVQLVRIKSREFLPEDGPSL